MSLFEDLVEELKDENLLELTVVESKGPNVPEDQNISVADSEARKPDSFEVPAEDATPNEEDEILELEDVDPPVPESPMPPPPSLEDGEVRGPDTESKFKPLAKKHTGETGKQYFRRRATDEVKGLQMVDHIISRVEKEQARISATPYDDLKVKQSLHKFLQLGEDADASVVAEIEFTLLQETESWYSALSKRDREISVENLRSYCESTVPSLSTQALLALARFYRNSPYSELVRSKFDLIITKLYTTDAGGGRREMILPLGVLVEDIRELYAEWASVPLYSANGDDSDLEEGAEGFVNFVEEARKANGFDELMSTDFFGRLNDFKQKSGETFFAPQIVVSAIRCNVAVGNRYIELIQKEQGEVKPTELSDKYGFLSDSAIAAAIRTVFSAHQEEEDRKEENRKAKEKKKTQSIFDLSNLAVTATVATKKKSEWYKANKKLVGATILTVVIGLAFFTFGGSSFFGPGSGVSDGVQDVNLEGTVFEEYVASARISKGALFAITNESWDRMAKTEKEQLMRQLLAAGSDKGYSQVTFLDNRGQKVGYISISVLELPD